MHRTQILLEDAQYERLLDQSRASGTGIGELVRRAVAQVYGSLSTRERLQGLEDSFGMADGEDFDRLDGVAYVARQRRGLSRRLAETTSE